MAYMSKQCFTYKKLKKQIGQQCTIYKKLHKNGELGSQPGMYQEKDGRKIPSECTSAYLRGGIITTMASFEKFMKDLLQEAEDTVLYERQPHEPFQACKDCENLEYQHVKTTTRRNEIDEDELNEVRHRKIESVLIHKWDAKYKNNLTRSRNPPERQCKELSKEIFDDYPFVYYYLLDEKFLSKFESKQKSDICAILRLFYGFRCIMAHGNAQETLDNPYTLKYWPLCPTCIKNPDGGDIKCPKNEVEQTIDGQHSIRTDEININRCEHCKDHLKFQSIFYLSEAYDRCIEEQGKQNVLKSCRIYPRKKPIEKLCSIPHDAEQQHPNQEKALEIIQYFFPNVENATDPRWNYRLQLGPSYAIFHLCRVYHWLKEGKQEMYITYNMLVRINQFILALAYRIKVAVAKIMMRDWELPDRTWGVPRDDDERETMIKRFIAKHESKVRKLQSLP